MVRDILDAMNLEGITVVEESNEQEQVLALMPSSEKCSGPEYVAAMGSNGEVRGL